MKAKYLIGVANDGYAFVGRKGSATNRLTEPSPVSTIAPITLSVAKKMLREFDKKSPAATCGMKIFELVERKRK